MANETVTKIPVEFSEGKQLSFGEQATFNGGYLFLQKLYHEIGLDRICSDISKKYRFEYDLSAVLSGLIFSRILSPSSKLSSYEFLQHLIEGRSFELHDIYRSCIRFGESSRCIWGKASFPKCSPNRRCDSVFARL